jgi:hypothetical protein
VTNFWIGFGLAAIVFAALGFVAGCVAVIAAQRAPKEETDDDAG